MRTFRTALLGLTLLVAACGGDDATDATEPATTTVAPTTTAATTSTAAATTSTTEAPAPESFASPGPYAVGVRTISLGDRDMELWYPVDPAAVAGSETEVFDTLSVFPESLQPLIPDELQGEVDTGAYRDAPLWADDGPYPIVVYSHGFGGYRQAATNYTTHLASWGYVVLSVDHVERGIAAQATGTLGGDPDQDVTDVRNALEALGTDAELGPASDFDHVGITGHSAGAGTAVRAAAQVESIDVFVSVAGGLPVTTDGGETGIRAVSASGVAAGTYELSIDAVSPLGLTVSGDGQAADVVPGDRMDVALFGGTLTLITDDPAAIRPGTLSFTVVAPALPGLVVIAERDEVVPPARSEALYAAMPVTDKWLVDIAAAGHNSFTDSCEGIRELGGLGTLIPLIGEAQVARAEDGCLPEDAPPGLVQQVLDHYTVAFLRAAFGQPVAETALTAAAVDAIDGIELADFRAG